MNDSARFVFDALLFRILLTFVLAIYDRNVCTIATVWIWAPIWIGAIFDLGYVLGIIATYLFFIDISNDDDNEGDN